MLVHRKIAALIALAVVGLVEPMVSTPAVAAPAVPTPPSVQSVDPSTSGCAPETTLVVPSRSSVAKFGAAALAPSDHPEVAKKVGANPQLMEILKSNPVWLTHLKCRTDLPPMPPTIAVLKRAQPIGRAGRTYGPVQARSSIPHT